MKASAADEMLHDKTLVMVVGPSAIGKSSIMHEAVRQQPDFGYVSTFTTRERRLGEQSAYRFITPDHAADINEKGRAITYFTHPTTGDVYGTDAESYPAQYNLLDTLANTVREYRSLPFRNTVTVNITAEASVWQQWFLERYPEPSAEAEKRLAEAKQSIEWSLGDGSYWIENYPGKLGTVAARLARIVLEQPEPGPIPDAPRDIIGLIERDVWNRSA